MTVAFVPLNSNTGASNITVNPLGSVSVLDPSGNALVSGAFVAGTMATLIFVGTAFRLVTTGIGGKLVYTNNVTASPPVTTTINCLGYSSVLIYLSLVSAPASGIYTFALSNLANGTPIDVAINPRGSSQVLKWTAATPSSVSYAPINALYSGGASPGFNTNLIGAGDSATNQILYRGVANLDPNTATNVIHFMAASF
jgi:hypothetical protein